MSKKFTGTLIGAAAGLFMSGSLLGAIVGGVLGNMFDSTDDVVPRRRTERGGSSGSTDDRLREFIFISNLVALMTSVAKVDREIHPAEVKTITRYFEQRFRYSGHDRSVIENLVRESARRSLNIRDLCSDTRRLLDYAERLMLLRMLYAVAFSDRVLKRAERERIDAISSLLQVSAEDHAHIKREIGAAARPDHYSFLELRPSATDEEVKSKYREMVKKYHPDRVAHLGKEFTDLATKKFNRIQEAYKYIARERSF